MSQAAAEEGKGSGEARQTTTPTRQAKKKEMVYGCKDRA
jgi:hypothetical protein